jgi:hypothetical protein
MDVLESILDMQFRNGLLLEKKEKRINFIYYFSKTQFSHYYFCFQNKNMQTEILDPRIKKLEEFKACLANLEAKLEKDQDARVNSVSSFNTKGEMQAAHTKLQELANLVGNLEGYELNRLGLKLWNQGVALSHKSDFPPEMNVQGFFFLKRKKINLKKFVILHAIILALSKLKTQDNDEETLLNLVSCFSRVGKLWTGSFSLLLIFQTLETSH